MTELRYTAERRMMDGKLSGVMFTADFDDLDTATEFARA